MAETNKQTSKQDKDEVLLWQRGLFMEDKSLRSRAESLRIRARHLHHLHHIR